jgi:hypothetical protein
MAKKSKTDTAGNADAVGKSKTLCVRLDGATNATLDALKAKCAVLSRSQIARVCLQLGAQVVLRDPSALLGELRASAATPTAGTAP